MIAALGSLTLFAASAAATFEATMVPRKGSERTAGPTFVVEAGGGRRTRILDFSYEGGKCGSIYAPLLDAGKSKAASSTATAPRLLAAGDAAATCASN